ncbi:MAG: hypothetical protein V3V22_07285 [Methylococcales bacterium]
MNNYGAGLLFLTKRSQEAHSYSTQRLRSFSQEQKAKPECSSYFMHAPKGLEINKSSFLYPRLVYFLLVVMVLPVSAHAEWIRATPNGVSNDIWINTESSALYSGDHCKSLMKLKHLSGRKPRNLQQRQQAYVNRWGKQSYADSRKSAKQYNSATDSLHAVGIDRQDARAAGAPLDRLNLSYQTQPEFDPLNRNRFNISITDDSILLTNQQASIQARIIGRYDHRPECGS